MVDFPNKAFKLLRSIKSVSVATISNKSPQNRIMDVMLHEQNSLFFITARGKPVYKQLKKTPIIAISALDKDYNMIRVTGKIRFCKQRKIVEKIFEKNPILNKIYPNDKKNILESFQLYKGTGELFELAKHPIKRTRFSFGGEKLFSQRYSINRNCVSCGECVKICPNKAIIKLKDDIFSIQTSMCLECGACYEKCPTKAIDVLMNF
jgi:uncharacterized pyridoxamine 5'-phosphate oxidase family protein/NAD-dependent dihydropyrimidine dehydrogenase PreA subunit